MSDSTPESTARLIAALWARNQPLMLERLEHLDSAAGAASSGELTEPIRAEAESTAHKLSGSLGMFGFHRGTELARELEAELRTNTPDPARLADLATGLRAELFPHK